MPSYNNEVTYTFNFFDDGSQILRGTIMRGETPQTPSLMPEREGYKFDGWLPQIRAIHEDTVFDAIWTPAYVTYTFDWGVNGITNPTGQIRSGQTPLTPEIIDNVGYEFVSWSPSVEAITSDTTFKAIWDLDIAYVFIDTNEEGVVQAVGTSQVGVNVIRVLADDDRLFNYPNNFRYLGNNRVKWCQELADANQYKYDNQPQPISLSSLSANVEKLDLGLVKVEETVQDIQENIEHVALDAAAAIHNRIDMQLALISVCPQTERFGKRVDVKSIVGGTSMTADWNNNITNVFGASGTLGVQTNTSFWDAQLVDSNLATSAIAIRRSSGGVGADLEILPSQANNTLGNARNTSTVSFMMSSDELHEKLASIVEDIGVQDDDSETIPAWDMNGSWQYGDRVIHDGRIWEARIAHTGFGDPNWAPGIAHGLWRLIGVV